MTRTVILVSVGTTAIFNEEIGEAPPNDDPAVWGTAYKDGALRNLVDDYELYVDGMRRRPGPSMSFGPEAHLEQQLIEAHGRYWRKPAAYTSDRARFRQTSAELTSTAVLVDKLAKAETSVQRIVLLGSDTPEGKLALAVNKAVMCAHFRPEIYAITVSGLDARFQDITAAIKAVIEGLCNPGSDDIYVNLTGGFKGTVVSLTCLAVMPEHRWRLYYQHESLACGFIAEFPGPPVPTPGPLRFLPQWRRV
jgi:CRISPR-associated protein (Cas_APE2256)